MVDIDVGAHTGQFRHMHETIFKDRLGDHGGPLSDRHQDHELRLQVGGETGIGLGHHIDPIEAVRRGGDQQGVTVVFNRYPGLAQGVGDRLDQLAAGADQFDTPAGERGGDGEGAGLDTVGDHSGGERAAGR